MISRSNLKLADVGWLFWLKWAIGSSLSWIVVFALSFFTIGTIVETLWGDPETVFSEPVFATLLGMIFALSFTAMGSVQWLLLRQKIERSGWWIPASSLGGVIVAVLYFALMGVVSEAANEIVHNGVAGAVVGLLQWRILRRQVAGAHLWIPATAVAFIIAGAGSAILRDITGMDDGTSSMFAIVALSALTGAAMVWLLRQPAPNTEKTIARPAANRIVPANTSQRK